MPEVQWIVTAFGLSAATLGLCLVAIIAHDAARRRRWMLLGVVAAAFAAATILFVFFVAPSIRVG